MPLELQEDQLSYCCSSSPTRRASAKQFLRTPWFTLMTPSRSTILAARTPVRLSESTLGSKSSPLLPLPERHLVLTAAALACRLLRTILCLPLPRRTATRNASVKQSRIGRHCCAQAQAVIDLILSTPSVRRAVLEPLSRARVAPRSARTFSLFLICSLDSPGARKILLT